MSKRPPTSAGATLDNLYAAMYVQNEWTLTDGQLIAIGLLKVADAIDKVAEKLARYLPDLPDHINDGVADALNSVADAITEAEKKRALRNT